MRVLLVHPADSPRRGPWSRQSWDLIVDLGKSSPYSQRAWADQFGCPVLAVDSFRNGVADARQVRQVLSSGRDRLVDEEGIDWWDVTSLLLAPEVSTILALQRVVPEIRTPADLWSTRPGWPARAMEILLHSPLQSFQSGSLAGVAATAGRYASLVRRFSLAQIREIFLDKYDSGYRWRSRLARRPEKSAVPVVLLPSAYGNVSRMAADYARMVPQQQFLMVATRQSAKQFTAPANVQVRDLAAYAQINFSSAEIEGMVARWRELHSDLCASAEWRVLSEAGILDPLPGWLRDGLHARDAWKEVLTREPVCAVLCGDDSNCFTRLPVLLAARRKIPTLDFHHGAFDGRYLLKDLPCDVYLAKNPMERDYLLRVCGLPAESVVLAAPAEARAGVATSHEESQRRAIVLFSEPYETGGMRAEEFYREVLPSLLRLARENDRRLVIKLHPFESRPQRVRLVRDIVGASAAESVAVVSGPLTPAMLAHAWCGITIESTTVLDCAQNGVNCFLCGWLALSPYEYAQQYARFGVGQVLESAEKIAEIPARIATASPVAGDTMRATPVDPALLQQWLTEGFREPSNVRSAS